ncbi:MAG TPA: hybrid sensor histidine kinase/response regulator [Azospirillaceae bacterium]|nr:hybrid sensor histidine kinase/response regulator [Azospirillaceae bacterium]
MSDSEIEREIKGAPILVIDDNLSNVILLTEILRQDGYTNVQSETDPRKVKGLCEDNRFELILLDIRMPYLDGFQVMERLKPLFERDFMPIVVLTAQTDQETRRRSLELGARDFLTKPIVSWELLRRVRNMLEIRLLYRRLHTHNHDLEARVEERTRELSGALSAAQRADRAKMDFLAVMSHELRTPLNSIIGFSEELAGESRGPLGHADYVEYVSLIEQGGKALLAMVNNILDYTKGATGAAILMESDVSLRRLLRTCLRVLGPKAEARQVAMTLADGDEVIVRADERRLREMTLSVIDNAIKFNNPCGRITVSVGAERGSVVLAVEDNGPGIPPEALDRVFEPFIQGEAAHARRHEGIGLGLAMVRRYAEMHEGHVELDSELGRGTVVRIVLPDERHIR